MYIHEIFTININKEKCTKGESIQKFIEKFFFLVWRFLLFLYLIIIPPNLNYDLRRKDL